MTGQVNPSRKHSGFTGIYFDLPSTVSGRFSRRIVFAYQVVGIPAVVRVNRTGIMTTLSFLTFNKYCVCAMVEMSIH